MVTRQQSADAALQEWQQSRSAGLTPEQRIADNEDIKAILDGMCVNVRNGALDAAAKVAALYGAPEEAVRRILMLRGAAK